MPLSISPPVHWYKFDESVSAASSSSSSNDVLDSGSGNSPSNSSFVTQQPSSSCVRNNCAGFWSADVSNGGDLSTWSSVTVSHATPPLTTAFTLSFWVLPNATHEIDPEAYYTDAGTRGQRYVVDAVPTASLPSAPIAVSVGTNGVSVYYRKDGYFAPLLVHQVAIQNWTQVTVVVTSDRIITLYLNGTFARLFNTYTYYNLHLDLQRVGASAYGPYSGMIDELATFASPFGPSEAYDWFYYTSTGQLPVYNTTSTSPQADPVNSGGTMQKFFITARNSVTTLLIPTWAQTDPCATVEVKLWGASGAAGTRTDSSFDAVWSGGGGFARAVSYISGRTALGVLVGSGGRDNVGGYPNGGKE